MLQRYVRSAPPTASFDPFALCVRAQIQVSDPPPRLANVRALKQQHRYDEQRRDDHRPGPQRRCFLDERAFPLARAHARYRRVFAEGEAAVKVSPCACVEARSNRLRLVSDREVSARPELVDQDAPERVVLVVADAPRDDVRFLAVDRGQPDRAVGEFAVEASPQCLGLGGVRVWSDSARTICRSIAGSQNSLLSTFEALRGVK